MSIDLVGHKSSQLLLNPSTESTYMARKRTPKPTAELVTYSDGYNAVYIDWSDAKVDRPRTYSISTGHGPSGFRLGERLRDAIDAGAAVKFNRIAKDDDGETYVDAEVLVMGRYLNADLKRLGF
jgi:hypothetical protein